MQSLFYQFKRTAIHNILITSSISNPKTDIIEGLVLPEKLMKLGDIVPYERILVTKHNGDNWINRVYSFAIPGDGETVEARGSLSHFLKPEECCCIISETYFNSNQYKAYCTYNLSIPIIDIRFHPENDNQLNNFSSLKIALEFPDKILHCEKIDKEILNQRQHLPRIMLSNLVFGLKVSEIERQCLEMNAELPVEIMSKTGLVKNQTIFVFNASRGGISAESFVVPNTRNNNITISGALSKVADIDDVISEAAFVITNKILEPTIFNAKNSVTIQHKHEKIF
ncbi:MAG: hypothetical protein HY934_04880 [Candidatus Firestonebacteria bacterium]|nr:hypothetical protein [Candidatus Firestonebacteria bacterium]